MARTASENLRSRRRCPKKIKDSLIFDAEEVGNAVRNSYPNCPYGYIFEDYPLWGDFCYRLLKDVSERFHKNILVPMTLLRKNSYSIIERLRADGIETYLIVLSAKYDTIRNRILSRGEEENCWCIENIELARSGSADLPGITLLTDDKSVAELEKEVISVLGIETKD